MADPPLPWMPAHSSVKTLPCLKRPARMGRAILCFRSWTFWRRRRLWRPRLLRCQRSLAPLPEAANANVPARPIAVLPVRTAIRVVRPSVVEWCGLPCRLRCPPNSAPCPSLWRPLGNPIRPHRFGLHLTLSGGAGPDRAAVSKPFRGRPSEKKANDLQELCPTRTCERRID